MSANSLLDFTATKADLRRQAKAARKIIPQSKREQIDREIFKKIILLPEYDRADVMMTYLSFGTEIDTLALIERCWSDGKRVALPRCVPGERALTWHLVSNLDQLDQSPLGMREPDPALCPEYVPETQSSALALVPGLVFDRQGYRIGYGGGYYDVFLSEFSGVSVGLVRRDFLSPLPLPHEANDVPVDMVVSE